MLPRRLHSWDPWGNRRRAFFPWTMDRHKSLNTSFNILADFSAEVLKSCQAVAQELNWITVGGGLAMLVPPNQPKLWSVSSGAPQGFQSLSLLTFRQEPVVALPGHFSIVDVRCLQCPLVFDALSLMQFQTCLRCEHMFLPAKDCIEKSRDLFSWPKFKPRGQRCFAMVCFWTHVAGLIHRGLQSHMFPKTWTVS